MGRALPAIYLLLKYNEAKTSPLLKATPVGPAPRRIEPDGHGGRRPTVRSSTRKSRTSATLPPYCNIGVPTSSVGKAEKGFDQGTVGCEKFIQNGEMVRMWDRQEGPGGMGGGA
jgi:hypothetical protein